MPEHPRGAISILSLPASGPDDATDAAEAEHTNAPA